MSRIKLRLTSQGWFWVMGVWMSNWGPNEMVVGPSTTAEEAYIFARRMMRYFRLAGPF